MNEDLPSIERIIPHRGRMLFIDGILSVEEGYMKCAAVVREDNPFLVDGFLQSYALVEYLAQAMAGLVGYQDFVADDDGPTIGYLVAARGIEIAEDPVEPGDPLTIEVWLEGRNPTFGNVHGDVFLGDRKICQGRVSFFREIPEG